MKKILILVCVLQLIATNAAFADKKIFVVGVEPKQNPVMVAEQWMPFLRDLSSMSEIELRFRTSRDVLEYNRAIKNNEFDFVINSPYLTTVFVQKYTINPIAKLHHVTDATGLALIGRRDRLSEHEVHEITIGVSENQRHADLQSISHYLAQLRVSYRVEAYRSQYEVVEAVREGLSQFGIVQYRDSQTRDRLMEYGLDILWVDEQSKVSYLSAMSHIDTAVLADITAVLAAGEEDQPWALQHGIAQIEVLGDVLSHEHLKALSLLKSEH